MRKAFWGKVKKVVGYVVAPVTFVFVAVVGYVKTSYAAIDLSDFTISMTAVETLVPIILTAGAGMWVVRKLIKSVNKS